MIGREDYIYSMQKIKEIIRKKPSIFVIIPVVYLVILSLLKWNIHPQMNTIYFILGGILGIYLMDMVEEFMHLNPSPFRSILFCGGFVIVSLFVVTSSVSILSQGLVLTLFLTLILWQAGQWKVVHQLDSWYQMLDAPVSKNIQVWIFTAFISIFIFESVLFIR